MTQSELNQKAVDEIRALCESKIKYGKWTDAEHILAILERNSQQAKEADRG